MISQLLRYLQRLPEKYSEQGDDSPDLLLLLDEFPVFGHIRGIADGVSTLRSKRVHFCFLAQSISQLDKVYGEYDRRIIFDNCQYKIILQACDPETQRFLADMIGTELHIQRSSGKQYNEFLEVRGYTEGKSSTREYAVQPHSLANLDTKCILISPYGVNEFAKVRYWDLPQFSQYIKETCDDDLRIRKIIARASEVSPANSGCVALSLEARLESVRSKIAAAKIAAEEHEAVAAKAEPMALEIGQRVLKYFPNLTLIEPGSEEENALRYKALEALLHVLSDDDEVLDRLREKSGFDHLLSDALSTQSSDM
jgi:type IV secretory pathway TraG/TraD family ATPase VirD4